MLASPPDSRVLLVAHGVFAHLAVDAATRMSAQGVPCAVVDPVWALPVNPALVELCGAADLVVTLEDGGVSGGLGAALALACGRAGVWTPLRHLGVPQQFLDHASRGEVLEELGLTAQDVARTVVEWALECSVRAAGSPPGRPAPAATA